MAKRYSGGLSISLTFVDSKNEYRTRVCPRQGRRGAGCETIWVGPPRTLRHAVDSPIAYDEAARAAISFSSDYLSQLAQPDHEGAGWDIRRKP